MKLISREAVEKLIDKYIEKHDTRKKPLFTAFSYDIDMLPTIESRQKGKWIDNSEEGYVECPFCRYLTNCDDNIEELHYCWNCGAELGDVRKHKDLTEKMLHEILEKLRIEE